MSRINLKRLITKREISSIISDCVALSDAPVTLWDANSNLLLGRKQEKDTQRYPVHGDGEVLGWVDGDDKASLLASMISFAARAEYEKRALSHETLNKYKKLIHLHDMTEQIALSLESEEVARVAIKQATQSIQATGASIMIYSEEQNVLNIAAAYGEEYHPKTIMNDTAGIAAAVMKSGKAEIINDVDADPRYVTGTNEVRSLMCAPLVTKGKSIGVFNVSSHEPYTYLAEDLKLLKSIASQTATALTNAQLFEQSRTYAEELKKKNVQLQTEIVQREQSEKALKASEEKYRLHFENVLDVIYSVDADLKIITMSPSVEKIMGYTPEELIGRVFTDLNLLTEDSLKRAVADTMRIMGGERIESAEYEFIAKDGSIKTGEVSSAPLFENGKIISIFSVARDITERIQTREALIQSEERFRTMAENIMDGLIIMENGKLVFANEKVSEITGYSPEELVARGKGLDIVAPEQQAEMKPIYDYVLAEAAYPHPLELWITRKDGKKRCVSKRLSLSSRGDNIQAGYEIITDITEKKKAEESLRTTSEFLDNIIESSLDCIIVGDGRGTLTRVNRYFLELLGYEEEEVIGKHNSKFIATEKGTFEMITGVSVEIDQEYIDKQQQMVSLLHEEKKVSNWEAYLVHRNGRLIPAEVNISYLYDAHGERAGAVGIVRDITQRKIAEKEIIETRDFLDNVIENSLDLIIISDARGYIKRVNKKFIQFLGYDIEELRQKHIAQCAPTTIGTYELLSGEVVQITQEFHDSQAAMIDTLLKKNTVSNWESFYCRKDGKLIPVEQNLFYLFNESREIIGSVGIVRDITERKKAERQIKAARDYLDNIIESSQDCIIATDPDGYLTRVNKYFLELLGYREDEVLGKHSSEFAPRRGDRFESTAGEVVTIDDELYDKAMAKMQQLMHEGKISNWEFYLVRKDNSIVPVEENLVYLYDDQRNKIGAVGILRNITERKKAEDKLRETTDFLDNIIESSLDCIVASDTKGYFTRVNKSFLTLLGYQKEEVLGRHAVEFAPPEEGIYDSTTRQIVEINEAYYRDQLTMMATLLEEEKVSNWEAYYCRKDKKVVPIEQNLINLYNKKGERSGTVAVLRDITWRKVADTEILSTRDFLKNIITTSLDGIIATDPSSTITMINRAAVDILGYSREELLGHRIQGFLEVGGEVEERGKQIQKILMKKGAVYGYEHSWKKKDGTFVDLEMSIALLQNQPEGIAGAVLSIRDITERKQAEKKILDYQDQLRSLASQLTLTEEQERRSIATDLHDRIGQTLAISKIKLGALRASTTSLRLSKDIDEIRDLVEQSIQDTRSLIFDLCPPFLYELGFEKALEWLLEDIQEQYGITTHLECDGKPYQLDDDLRILLYQSVRELFVNIVKHAQARHARLSLQRATTTLNLCVEDDGCGFDESTRAFRFDKEGGFGLFRIKERFHHLGGEITIDSKPHQGTRISLVLPVKSSEHPYKEDVQ
jgi:PAS domain S-box-containing protein